MTLKVQSYVCGAWVSPGPGARPIQSAITGEVIAEAGGAALDFSDMLSHATTHGAPALQGMSFHDRARLLKALATALNERKQELYELSYDTGATTRDHAFDIDGGIGTMFVFASKGRREMPDGHVYIDGDVEHLGREGRFLGQHICTPLQGVAVHINAFNFPLWGMLEKLAPTWLAGVPAIVKPATATSYVTEAAVRIMLDTGLVPEGALQLVAGGTGDLLDRLGPQDIVSFTGSAATALQLRSAPNLLQNATRFVAEQDSLNASILCPDAELGTPEFELFVKEVVREMTVKAGQKCTAIRRIFAPENLVEAITDAIAARLAKLTIGDPRAETTRIGALVSTDQRDDVLQKAALIEAEAERVFGDPENFDVVGADAARGAFLPPMLFRCADPDRAETIHSVEAFGPVSTVMGYNDLDHAVALVNRGQGSLVASVITHDPETARRVAMGAAAWHGRLYFNNRDSMAEATGHGAPMPHLIHGGPGRAGGGEEMGGVRGVMHYMQRTAVQGSPDILSAITGRYIPGASQTIRTEHPFRRSFGALDIGDTLVSGPRVVTLSDIEHFAAFTGDTFYAHMDEKAARANPFFPGRVAHGYLLLSFAAGLFVDPAPGPVLANTGLDKLSFQKPVSPGDAIRAALTVMAKTGRTDAYGEVRWHVRLTNQDDEQVASYELLTMVSR